MKEKIHYPVSSFLIRTLVKNDLINEQDTDIYMYCANNLIETGFFITIMIITGLVLNNFMNTVLFLIILFSIRSFSGGFHANTTIGCFFLSYFLYIVNIFFANKLECNTLVNPIVLSILIVIIVLLSPVDCKQKRLSYNQKNIYRKVCLIICLLVLSAFIFLYFLHSSIINIIFTSFVTVLSIQVLGIIKNLREGKK